jgi:hypothetical protein
MSERQSIFVNASDFASFIGKNKWNVDKVFERFWEKVEKHVVKIVHEEEVINDSISSPEQVKEICNSTEDPSRKKRKLNELLEQSISDKTRILQNLIEIKSRIKDENSEFKIETLISSGNTNTEDVNVIIKTISNLQINPDISKPNFIENFKSQLRNVCQKSIDSHVNKTHGIINETKVVKEHESSVDKVMDTSQQLYKRLFVSTDKYDWYICGRIDGIYDSGNPDTSYILEIKNRIHKLFNEIKSYEHVQIQVYMWLTGYTRAKLIEKYKSESSTIEVNFNETQMNNNLEDLKVFINNFESFIESGKQKYLGLKGLRQKQNFIRKMIFYSGPVIKGVEKYEG